MTSRKHAIAWMGRDDFKRGIETMIARHGPSWLTDGQVADVLSEVVASQRRMGRMNAASRGGVTAAEDRARRSVTPDRPLALLATLAAIQAATAGLDLSNPLKDKP